MLLITNDYVIQNFDFHYLPGTYQITGHFDVGLRWRGITSYAATSTLQKAGFKGEFQSHAA